jgi:hypothetical protein
MVLDKETKISLTIVAAVMLAQAILLAPEAATSRLRDNDSVGHYTLTRQMVSAIEHGDNFLDFWSPEVALGVPMVRRYQPLAHLMTAAAYFGLGKTVSLETVFSWARFLLLILLPATCYAAMRMMGFAPLAGAAAALLMPLIAGPDGDLAMELRTWMHYGEFPQLLATHLLLLTMAVSFQAIRGGKRVALAGTLLGLTFLAHFMYGWMGALTACVIALAPDGGSTRRARIARTMAAGTVALALSAFLLAPLYIDRNLISRPCCEPPAKFDSYGAAGVLKRLFDGETMDSTRLPVLSLLSLAGLVLLGWRYRKTKKLEAPEKFILIAGAFWLLVYFGRPNWGPALLLIGATRDLHLHRVIALVQILLLMTAGIALSAFWREAARRGLAIAAAIVTALLLAPMVLERAEFVKLHFDRSEQTAQAMTQEGPALEQAIALAHQRGGRVYAGFLNAWGGNFTVGATDVASFLVRSLTPAVSHAYNNSVLTADVMGRFDDMNPAHYGVFNVQTVILPAAPREPAPLRQVAEFGRFHVTEGPGAGYVGLVDVPAAAAMNRDNFYSFNDAWLHSDWVAKKQYVWMDFTGGAPKELRRLSAGPPFPAAPAASVDGGAVSNEHQTGQVYEADLNVSTACYALFRMTYHYCWKAYVDGASKDTTMVSPGYPAVAVAPGRHHIVWRYEPGNWKLSVAAVGVLIAGLAMVGETAAARKRTGGK